LLDAVDTGKLITTFNPYKAEITIVMSQLQGNGNMIISTSINYIEDDKSTDILLVERVIYNSVGWKALIVKYSKDSLVTRFTATRIAHLRKH